MRAHLRINACHVPMATVFPEDVYRACTFRSFCASKNCGAGTLKHGAFEFERGRPKHEGGRSATVCRFGENPVNVRGLNAYSAANNENYNDFDTNDRIVKEELHPWHVHVMVHVVPIGIRRSTGSCRPNQG